MGRRYLVTGGAGFIGSNFIRYVLAVEPDATYCASSSSWTA